MSWNYINEEYVPLTEEEERMEREYFRALSRWEQSPDWVSESPY